MSTKTVGLVAVVAAPLIIGGIFYFVLSDQQPELSEKQETVPANQEVFSARVESDSQTIVKDLGATDVSEPASAVSTPKKVVAPAKKAAAPSTNVAQPEVPQQKADPEPASAPTESAAVLALRTAGWKQVSSSNGLFGVLLPSPVSVSEVDVTRMVDTISGTQYDAVSSAGMRYLVREVITSKSTIDAGSMLVKVVGDLAYEDGGYVQESTRGILNGNRYADFIIQHGVGIYKGRVMIVGSRYYILQAGAKVDTFVDQEHKGFIESASFK